MSTAPDPPLGSASDSAPASDPAPGSESASEPGSAHALSRGAVWAMAVSTAVYPFLVGTVLIVGALTGGFGPSFGDTGSMVAFAVVALVLTGGAHYLLLAILRHLRAPAPGSSPQSWARRCCWPAARRWWRCP